MMASLIFRTERFPNTCLCNSHPSLGLRVDLRACHIALHVIEGVTKKLSFPKPKPSAFIKFFKKFNDGLKDQNSNIGWLAIFIKLP